MECAHCGHDHVNPVTGQIDIDRCFSTIEGWEPGETEPCPCQDFDH